MSQLTIVPGKGKRGTYADEQAVYEYASWISPERPRFHARQQDVKKAPPIKEGNFLHHIVRHYSSLGHSVSSQLHDQRIDQLI